MLTRRKSTATTVILSERLAARGDYRVDDASTPPWAGVTLMPSTPSLDTPIIVATHLQQPSLGNTTTWREHLDWVRRTCASSPYVIVLGDLNSTLNNLGSDTLAGCTDVAARHGAGAAATWPTALPPALGVSIDRFMVGAGYAPTAATFQVIRDVRLQATDHWPIHVSF